MKQLHPIQLQILRKLVFSPDLRYTEIKPDKEMDNNQFDFHLDTLIKAGYIKKEGTRYLLTPAGKTYTAHMDTADSKVKIQAKLGAWLYCTREVKGQREYLIYTRLKHPFYGCQGFPSGKIAYGEKAVEAAKRELKEETDLEGEPILIHIRHYRVYDQDSRQLLEDKIFFLYHFSEPQGELIESNEEGKYAWVAESELQNYVTNPFESWEAFTRDLDILNSYAGKLTFVEMDHFNAKF